ncbi:ribosomal protein S5 domain 2-like protein [Annulohypoxylon maeteangense]|uniref:ribosomal protein S5 domain 2-like protein n=1 Tax=Annulohypoxylon maeteangense TaxID=1927788 RepID=UPI002007ACC1|nr:ribosomal protein S5 domain 2-like protein [Annulohypoxylon maeteangense]KAI0886243.1 ribosomal protein S5 domain 2-like protein [Annulohypoxylon maeteangense]
MPYNMATSSSLTLTSTTFAKLSPHPFLLANLQPPDPTSTPSARTNGRQPRQIRPYNINISSLSHAHGSAVVRSGDTTVICGVRGETLLSSQIPNFRALQADDNDNDELRDYDLLVPNVELATGCAPNFLPGVPPTTLAQTLSTRLFSLLHSSKVLSAEDLRIYYDPAASATTTTEGDEEMEEDTDEFSEVTREVKAYWVLYIDVLFISFDGNPFDVAWAAILAALRDTKLPRAYWDVDREMVLCARPTEAKKAASLSIRGLPVACTAAVFTAKERQKKGGGKYWILVDPDRLEESLCDETVTMVVDGTEGELKILAISKNGGTVVGPALMREFADVAGVRWREFRAVLQ